MRTRYWDVDGWSASSRNSGGLGCLSREARSTGTDPGQAGADDQTVVRRASPPKAEGIGRPQIRRSRKGISRTTGSRAASDVPQRNRELRIDASRRRRSHNHPGSGRLISRSGAQPTRDLGEPTLRLSTCGTTKKTCVVPAIITVIAQHCRPDPLTSGLCTRAYTSRC